MKSQVFSATRLLRCAICVVILLTLPYAILAQLSERVTEICEVVHPIGWVKFKEGINVAGDRVFLDYAENFGLGANDEMRLIRHWTDDLGYTHHRYQQYHAGIPIEYAMFTIQSKNGRSVSGNGRIAAYFKPNPGVAVTKQQAFQTAVASLPFGIPSWLDHHSEEFSRRVLNVYDFTSYPESQLMFVRRNGEVDYTIDNLVLAYKIQISTTKPAGHFELCIDAVNQAIIRLVRSSTGCTGETASGTTLYNGAQDVIVTESGSEYLLEADCHGTTIRTMKAGATSDPFDISDREDIELTDLDWPSTPELERYTQAQWSAQVTHEYFRTEFDYFSYDNANALMLQVIGGLRQTNWHQEYGILAVRDLSLENAQVVTDWAVALDVIGHEWTHALTCDATGLGNATPTAEFGALYESFGDIFGSLIECYGKENYDADNPNDCEDYVMYEEFVASQYRRNMVEPGQHNHPDTVCGTYWPTDVNSFHARGGVQNRWFTLLAKQKVENNQNVNWTGRNNHCCSPDSFSVSPIGRTKAAELAFRNLTTKVKPHFNYVDAMLGSLASADELIAAGKLTSADKQQIVEAWKAVGVYENKVGYSFRRCRTYESDADEKTLEAIVEIRAGSCGSVGTIVKPSATLTYTAGSLVLLRGEFVAESGCTFTARIAEPCTTFFTKSIAVPTDFSTYEENPLPGFSDEQNAPTVFCAPNPISVNGTIWFSLSQPGIVRVSLIDHMGREVVVVVDGEDMKSGSYWRDLVTHQLATGVDVCRIESNGHVASTIVMVSR